MRDFEERDILMGFVRLRRMNRVDICCLENLDMDFVKSVIFIGGITIGLFIYTMITSTSD